MLQLWNLLPSVLILKSFLLASAGWDIELFVTTQVSDALGGEAFGTQPVVTVYDRRGNKQYSIQATVVVDLYDSPTGYEDLHDKEGSNGEDREGEDFERGGMYSAPVIGGEARFSGLLINAAGDGYTLRFLLKDEHDITLGYVIGDPFPVLVGEAHSIGLVTNPESAFGGTRWGTQPIVAVQDKGFNTVTDINTGEVSIELVFASAHSYGVLRLMENAETTIPIADGLAKFQGLYINEAGTYKARFTTLISLPGGSSCDSTPFTIGVGTPDDLVIVTEPSEGKVSGGRAFSHQPRIEIIDAGGNLLVDDFSSLVMVSLYSNPSGGVLSPDSNVYAEAHGGVAQFKSLSIDKAGIGFRLTYTLFLRDINQYVRVPVEKLGDYFDIFIGEAFRLDILNSPSDTWAGNQPFPVQPKIGLIDVGGNVLLDDSSTFVHAYLTPSLAHASHLVIDTTHSGIPEVLSVKFLHDVVTEPQLGYGPGDLLAIEVSFSHEVLVVPSPYATSKFVHELLPPSLELNVIDGVGPSYVRAYLAQGSTTGQSEKLIFDFFVAAGHSQPKVTYLSAQSLERNDFLILDGLGRDVALDLPQVGADNSLGKSKELSVDDGAAYVMGISTPFGSGEYGAGQNITFHVQFSRKVIVDGSSLLLPMNIRSLVIIIDTVTSGFISSGSVFHIWHKDARSMGIPWDASAEFVKYAVEQLSTISGAVCVSRSASQNSVQAKGYRWAFRFETLSDNPREPSLLVDSSGMSFSDSFNSEMALSAQHLSTAVIGWVANDGDEYMCTLRTASYIAGSSTSTLSFEFVVMPGDEELRLDVDPDPIAKIIYPTSNDLIRNSVNNDNSKAITADPQLRSSGFTDVIINVDTEPPAVEQVLAQVSTTPDGIYTVGDILYFEVLFSKPVVAEKDAELVLNTGDLKGFAKLDSGSGSEKLILKYSVLENQISPDLNYDGAFSLISRNKVPGWIRRLSTTPTTDAILTLPTDGNTLADTSAILIDGLRPIITRISFPEYYNGQIFVEREDILIIVEFSVPIVVLPNTLDVSLMPTLIIEIGQKEREAVYSGGSGSPALTFTYTVKVGDSSPSSNVTSKRLCAASMCLEGGSFGYIRRMSSDSTLDADLTLPRSEDGTAMNILVASSADNIAIDTSSATPSTVVAITTSKQEGDYGVGEEIRLHVEFTDIVHCSGTAPVLRTNFGTSPKNIEYESGSGTNTLTFRHVVSIHDSTKKLDWVIYPGSNSAIICNYLAHPPCLIKNENEEEAVLDFFDPSDELILPSGIGSDIAVDVVMPSILSVYTKKPRSQNCLSINTFRPSLEHCVYSVGEVITIFVKYDIPVVVLGPGPRLRLNVSNLAEGYADYDQDSSNDTDLALTYEIEGGHSSSGRGLTYTCIKSHCSLDLGKSRLASVKRKASFPTTDANLTLPQPPTTGISADVLNPIIIETSDVPRVLIISGSSENGVYAPGDTILISIKFSEVVIVVGVPELNLDVGGGEIGVAKYYSGSGSTDLIFNYTVGEGETSLDLDYIDIHSLHPGKDGVYEGYIRLDSSHPAVDADLLLPDPGMVGSLGVSSDIIVDNRVPHVMLVSSPENPGRYGVGDIVSMLIEFSLPIVVSGNPYILLETGTVDRHASFTLQLNDTTLEFQYKVRLGDESNDLDYWVDEGLMRSSTSSFHLNGGSIKRMSAKPILDADLHLNPGRGFLDGTKDLTLNEGVGLYTDLKIGKRGVGYKIRFHSTLDSNGAKLAATSTSSIGMSVEYEIIGDQYDRDVGDLFGKSVSLSGYLLAVGAPHKRNPTPEVQVLTVYSEASTVKNEIQLITTEVNRTEATRQVQVFSTSANPAGEVGGTFSLSCIYDTTYIYASPVVVNVDSDSDQLKTIIEEAFPLIGTVETSRESNSRCNCSNAWIWSVTFVDASLDTIMLGTNGNDLKGSGATISVVEIFQDTRMIEGSFYLFNPFTNARSRDIPYDASGTLVKEIIKNDLSINVNSVLAANTDTYRDNPQLGRRWTITFSHHAGEFGKDVNVPNLEVNHDLLVGIDAMAWTHVGFEGRGPLSGQFSVSLRGSDFSSYVPYDSSAAQLKAALMSLDSVNSVSVSSRKEFTEFSQQSGSIWTITFHSVNHRTDYAWQKDPGGESTRGNLPALEVESRLVGWNAQYNVENEFGAGDMDTQAQWMEQTIGDVGFQSGSVTVLEKDGEQFRHEAKLVCSDHNSHDAFGHSVSLSNSYLLVGAPSKEVDGIPEQQSLECIGPASSGSFVIKFRGFKSDTIPFDATSNVIAKALTGTYGNTTNIHTLPRISVTGTGGWDGESNGFCSTNGNAVLITFFTPDGGGISTVDRVSADIEDIIVDGSQLVDGFILSKEVQKGTKSFMGKDLKRSEPTGKQAGSAYLFQRQSSCEFCPLSWLQVYKFTPMDGLDFPRDSAEFGWAVATGAIKGGSHQMVVIGSPGFMDESGKVYLFRGSDTIWAFDGSLTSEVWTSRTPGDRFGDGVQIEGDTILVSAPGYSIGRGAVFVFRQRDDGMEFLSSQAILGPNDLVSGDRFGQSIAMSGNNIIICAPGKDEKVVHVVAVPSIYESNDAGACYVYSRKDPPSSYKFFQKLMASNLKPRDRFGWSVAISGPRILVGQLEDAVGELVPPRPVQVIRTYCGSLLCADKLGSSFQLSWREDSVPLQTRHLSAAISENRLKDALQEDLHTGPITVSRSVHSDKDGGYSWSITFDSFSPSWRKASRLPVLRCIKTEMTGSSPECTVHVTHDLSKKIRSKVHLFTCGSDNIWTEQSFLFPRSPQRQDMFGMSVALDSDIAVVGATNRELLNINSGAAIVFNTNFLKVTFALSEHRVTEGDSLSIEVSRDDVERTSSLYTHVKTIDRNAPDDFQNFIDELYSFRSSELFPYDKTAIDMLTQNTALGRNQYYGSSENRSQWVNGMFDYRGISDYRTIDYDAVLRIGQTTFNVVLETTDDHIYEHPDENLTLQVDIPGMFASHLGGLTTHVVIEDNRDGFCPDEPLTHYTKVSADEGDRFGSAIDVDKSANMMIVGSEFTAGLGEDGTQLPRSGKAFIYELNSGTWSLNASLSAFNSVAFGLFGQSVAINKPYGRNDVTVLIGAPGQAKVFVFVLDNESHSWVEQAVLVATDRQLTSEHRFGGANAIALHGDLAFVGCSETESVYAFRRLFIPNDDRFEWVIWTVLKSSDFDYDIYHNGFTVKHIHQQGFGVALAAHRRSLLVGAPYADYGNRGDPSTRETFDTDGMDNMHLGKGKVFAFFSQPHVQLVQLSSDEKPTSGSFRLALDGRHWVSEGISTILSHDASSFEMKRALELADNVGEVHVISEKSYHESRSDKYRVTWRISFLSEIADSLPLLTPLWAGNGCTDCEEIQVTTLSDYVPMISVKSVETQSGFMEEYEIQAEDKVGSDGFGLSIGLDGAQSIIGAMNSAARTRTTWDFETGDLVGWKRTGHAFDFQPTHGDNSRHRTVYDGFGDAKSKTTGVPQSANIQGRYYVGTYEKHPGDGNDYTRADGNFAIGSFLGDEPVGSLTSDPFMILGDTITFLIGGGCDHLNIYTELLVDGFSTLRATGKCTERMERIKWEVGDFMGRASQIRIVDASKGRWGHINVDDIKFSWDKCLYNVNEECVEGGGSLPKKDVNDKQHYTGREESASSGAAYFFIRHCDINTDRNGPFGCVWQQQERVAASDKRPGNLFGFSVAVDDEEGVALVGSIHSPAYGFYQETPSVYPYKQSTFVEFPVPEDLEVYMRSGNTHAATGGNLRLIDHIAFDSSHERTLPEPYFNEKAGSVYVFLRVPAEIDHTGEVLKAPYWKISEDAKLSPPDVLAQDKFGHSVALDGVIAAAGAIGADSFNKNSGVGTIFDMRWQRVAFSQTEYVALEGTDFSVKIFIQRDFSFADSTLTVGYSTSDLSATGVDSMKFSSCESLSVPLREGCGDYEQTSGQIVFEPGVKSIYFEIRVMNDFCKEKYLEYVQLNLHIPGGGPINGERFRSQLRIDDDDWEGRPLNMACSGGIG